MNNIIENIHWWIKFRLCDLLGHKYGDWFDVHMTLNSDKTGYIQRQTRPCVRCPYGNEFRNKPDGKIYTKEEYHENGVTNTIGSKTRREDLK